MTRLKELRLHGFKTFADPTVFAFERGVTAVIGPNGSGKSNMADAVRWVLGEQSNRSLRTRRADDVIFAGSEGRRPQGLAEVTLTLDNRDGWLPIDFGEVSIGRRAYRSGETEYLINGARTRLKDVIDLLAGGRLGANELVVVGQGTVDAALSLRPEERRQLFEEAAGVKNLQVKKNEALGRLSRARDNLSRVGDLISELKPQVRRLALQARHQEEHDALGRRARALVVEVHRRQEADARAALGEARRRAAAAEAALEELRGAEAADQAAMAEAEAGYWAAESAAREAAERREISREAAIRAEARSESINRREAELAAAIALAETELAGVAALLEAPGAGPEPRLDELRAEVAAAEARWRGAVAGLEAADHAVIGAHEALAAARTAAAAQIAHDAEIDETAARAAARVDRIERELAAATAAAGESAAAAAPARSAFETARRAEVEAHSSLDAAQRRLDAAEPRAEAARQRATALAERVGGLRAQLEALREHAEEGDQLGARLSAAGWATLAETLGPPVEAWAAIEALIGGELQQALVWQDADLSSLLIDARGAARLVVEHRDGGGSTGDRAQALAAVGATQTVAEWIGADAGLPIFARAVVAPDLASLLRGWEALPPGWCAVTRGGDMADRRGLVTVRGRADEGADEGSRREARRRDLAGTVARLDQEHEQAGQLAARELAELSAARREAEAAAVTHATAQEAAARAREQFEREDQVATRAQELEALLTTELGQARVAAAAFVEAGSPATGDGMGTLLTAVADADRRRAAAAEERDLAGGAWRDAETALNAAESPEGRRRDNRTVAAARRDQLSAGLAADRRTLAAIVAERAEADSTLASAVTDDQTAASERAVAEAERDRLRAELLERERGRSGRGSRLADLEHEMQSSALDAQRREDALAAIGRERDLALESLPIDEVGTAAVGSDAADPELTATAGAAIEDDLRRVRRTLSQLGSVNPFAIEEHRELAARLEALSSQDSDLGAAIASTEQLIARLDAEIGSRFNLAFTAIAEKFDEFCRLLFAGGSASLQVGEASDGDAAGGIEIAVQPPGKRLQRLAMLSGGERALAGVALLFAMLSVNPVPFCILDEVDAALDEANIGRFAEALRKLAEAIDFVVITHNRATIEIADTIYGVTMTDAAVSRLISLRLADIPSEAAVG